MQCKRWCTRTGKQTWQCNNDVCCYYSFTWCNYTFSADSCPVGCVVVNAPFSEQMDSLVPSADKKEWARPGLHWFDKDWMLCLWRLGSKIWVYISWISLIPFLLWLNRALFCCCRAWLEMEIFFPWINWYIYIRFNLPEFLSCLWLKPVKTSV